MYRDLHFGHPSTVQYIIRTLFFGPGNGCGCEPRSVWKGSADDLRCALIPEFVNLLQASCISLDAGVVLNPCLP